MDIIQSPQSVAEWSARTRAEMGKIGFVPTMGALHEGHIALIHNALSVCDQVICSIFVNPLQFGDPEDLAKYPRQLEQDRVLLEAAGCHVLFAPEKETLFAGHTVRNYDLGGIDLHWEGPSRPGHFQGVVNVVERLFHYVRPDLAFFGEKDRQQLTILRHVARTRLWPEAIIPFPTVRGKDGLALSSRNARLSPTESNQAAVLYKALKAAQEAAFRADVGDTRQAAINILATEPDVRLDHFGIADAEDLSPLTEWGDRRSAVALIAAQVGPVRLIDNITLTR